MVSVRRSTVIDAPIEQVWRFLRDFNAHDRWHPGIAASRIEGRRAPDEIAAVRDFRLADGAAVREQLLALSDRDHSFTYCILDAPLALVDYVATVRLKPVTDGSRTFWEWRSSFSPPPEQAEELSRLVAEQIYETGFEAVKRHFGQGPAVFHRDPAPAAMVSKLTCQGILVEAHGGPEVLSWREVEVPAPGPGEVRLRHSAVGVNFIDVYCRSGAFDLLTPPGTPGMEAAGVIDAVGPGVEDLRPGDRVAYACAPVGAYCEARTLPAELLVTLPDHVDDATAAAALLKGMTAEFLLHRVHLLRAGETVLVHAAAGGVGSLLTQWASHLGATVIGIVSTAEKARLARRQGCAEVIVAGREGFAEQVMALTGGKGADAVFDAVGRDSFEESYEALAVHGHLVSYGQASGPIAPVDVGAFAAKSARLSRPNFGHFTGTRAELQASSRRLFEALRSGIVRVEIGARFSLREAARAHAELEARRTTGSILLQP